MIQSKLYRNIKIICGNDILVNNNNVMYLVWMYIMRWMNNGYGDQGGDPAVQRQLQTLQDQMQDNHNSDLIMQAIKGNSSALQDLTTRLSCDAIQSAIQSVQSSIANVGSQVGFSSERIINAVNSGDSGIIQALNNCCCSTQKEILKMGYENQINNQNQTYQLTSQLNGVNNVIQNGFRDTNYATQQQTCSLQNTIKEYVDKTLEQYNVQLEKNVGCDYVFVANMCKADYYGSSITDEKHFALYIKDTIDDEDAGDGTTMRRWYATMVANGTMVDWEEFI